MPSVYREIVNPGLMDTDGWANKNNTKTPVCMDHDLLYHPSHGWAWDND